MVNTYKISNIIVLDMNKKRGQRGLYISTLDLVIMGWSTRSVKEKDELDVVDDDAKDGKRELASGMLKGV